MTSTDAWLLIAIIIVLALYAAWQWDEAKNAIPYPGDTESQNKGAQAHETTSNEETPSSETKTQQEARK